MPRDCCVALPHGDMGLSEVCDCEISCPYSLSVFVVFAGGSCLALRVKRLYCVISSLAILSLR